MTDESEAARRSLLGDVEDLLVDARIWFDAEVAYQKTRAGFVAASLKQAIALLVVAAVLALVALIGLTVGLIISLMPLLGALGSTLLVTAALLLVALLITRSAAGRWRDAAGAIRESEE
ncbi:phage holin family protein [Alteraurantiacibacter buctensis]|uniref:Phage holin family protein n=1 Tax=Alteraurantiacibacter buctensis TaxID=1503981 RepID=A0A844YX51_9SPHN|nr:phage holin family protein [Alteraurantiacibacter buctensis]